jgi:uncharacterized membrane protein YdcZ (DUF606 family)
MVLRNSPISWWMYLAYGVGKILMVVLACYAIYSVAVELAASSPDAGATAMAWMMIVGLPGAILPVVSLVVINLKGVREFLGTPVVGRIF